MIVVRLLAYLGLVAIGLSLAMFLLTRDTRYLRFTWQLLKFSLVLLLVLGALLLAGRAVLR